MMERTIKAMKGLGLFNSLAIGVKNNSMTTREVEDIILTVCEENPDFEDIFLTEIHKMGMKVIMEELKNSDVPEYHRESAEEWLLKICHDIINNYEKKGE